MLLRTIQCFFHEENVSYYMAQCSSWAKRNVSVVKQFTQQKNKTNKKQKKSNRFSKQIIQLIRPYRSAKDKLLCSTGGMIMTVEDRTTQRKASPRATSCTTKQSVLLWSWQQESCSRVILDLSGFVSCSYRTDVWPYNMSCSYRTDPVWPYNMSCSYRTDVWPYNMSSSSCLKKKVPNEFRL